MGDKVSLGGGFLSADWAQAVRQGKQHLCLDASAKLRPPVGRGQPQLKKILNISDPWGRRNYLVVLWQLWVHSTASTRGSMCSTAFVLYCM